MSHVVLANNKALCRGCGATYDLFPGGKSREIWEFAALAQGFAKQHDACAPTDDPESPGAPALRCSLCGLSGHQYDGCNEAHCLTAEAWIQGHDTCLSSKTIWCFMSGRNFGLLGSWGPYAPADPDDFGRCYRLLKLAPDWCARMPEMVSVRGWEKLALAWEELTALYEEEIQRPDWMAPKLYARMRELRGEDW